MNSKILLRSLLLLVSLWVVSCKKDNLEDEDIIPEDKNEVSKYDYSVIWEWNELYALIDKDALGYRPLPGPRALAYMGLAAYETAVPGMPKFNSLKTQWGTELQIPSFEASRRIHWPTALNASYGYLMERFFFNTKFVTGAGHLTNTEVQRKIDALQNSLEVKYKGELNDNTVFNDSKAWGESVATAVWKWAITDPYGHESDLNALSNDKSKEFYYDWRAKSLDANGKPIPGRWVPTNDNPDGGMFPFGGRFRTFATTEAQKLSAPPVEFSEKTNSRFYAEALNVYNSSNASMSYEQRWIAEFWSDDIFGQTFSPPTRLLAILDQVLAKENSDLEKAVESVAKLGLALNDFGVTCWHSKYHYNLERPEHYIKRIIDPTWEPILNNTVNGVKGITPAFPAFPSGHSTFGGGGGVILAHLFGQNYEFTDQCHKGRTEFIGTPRTFGSFEDAGLENALSRVPLGVHFLMDCLTGVELGKSVSRRVLALPWEKK
jgi:hypothetical protein